MKTNKKENITDINKVFEYMDKMGVEYTVNRNPSVEEIARIKSIIKRNAIIRTYTVIKKNKY